MPRGISNTATKTATLSNQQSQLMSNQYHLGNFTIVPYGNGQNFEVFKAANNGLQPIAQDIASWRQFCGLLLNQLGWLKGYNNAMTQQRTVRNTSATARKNAVAPVTGQTNVTSGRNVSRRNVSGRTNIRRSKTPALATSATSNNSTIPA